MGSSLTKGTVRVQVRKDDASGWTTADPTLAVGEFGFETDTGKLKIGDGSTAWTALAYVGQFTLRDDDDDSFVISQDTFLKVVAATGTLGTNIAGSGTTGDPWVLTITSPDTTTNTMGSGFTVSATTDTNATTITQGDDLLFTAGTGIACETTADGTVTITNDLLGEELSSVLLATGNATDGHVLTAVGDGSAAWEAAGGGANKHIITGLHRYSTSVTGGYYGGYQSSYQRGAVLYGIDNEAETGCSPWTAMNYSEFMAPAAGTITSFKAAAYQNNSSSNVSLNLFKVTFADTASYAGLDEAACDFIGKIDWTADASSRYIFGPKTCGSLDGTAADFAEGDVLLMGFQRVDGSDALYWYIRHSIEFTYD